MDHALTIRLPEGVYRAARKMASRHGISLNRLVQEALAARAARSVKERLDRTYDLLAEDPAQADAERFLALQAEALLDG